MNKVKNILNVLTHLLGWIVIILCVANDMILEAILVKLLLPMDVNLTDVSL